MSRPAWDAWIEIDLSVRPLRKVVSSRPAWDAWIEIYSIASLVPSSMSRPAWDAWIEIRLYA